jgi:hypothetical protein
MTTPGQPTGSQRLSYADALTLAATLNTAAVSPQIVTSTVGGLSDQVAAVRDRALTWAVRIIQALWANTNPYDGHSVAAFAADAGRRTITAQTAAARSSAASIVQGLAVMGVHTPATASDPADVRRFDPVDGKLAERPDTSHVDYTGADQTTKVDVADEATTDQIFNRVAQTYRYQRSVGADHDMADRAAQARIITMVDENIQLADRLAAAQVLQQTVDLDVPGPKIIGYRRIIHPELSRTGTCGLCIAASDRLYHVVDLQPIHARCKCETAAVTTDFDPGKQLNEDDLAQLYRAASGIGGDPTTAAPSLKRVRYLIDEHGELGPVLVPNRAHKPRKTVPTQPRRRKTKAAK